MPLPVCLRRAWSAPHRRVGPSPRWGKGTGPSLGLALALALACTGAEAQPDDWQARLTQQIQQIDARTPGRLGVYIKRLDNGQQIGIEADRPWYLGSTTKLPIAITVLQDVQAGRLRLDQQVVLGARDKVDGSGNVVWQPDGSRFRIDALVNRMLMQSDNTAANMLVRTVGLDRLNQNVGQLIGPGGFSRLTDFAQVRYDVYAELHPNARKLSNLQLVQIAAAPMGPKRVDAVRRALQVDAKALQVPDISAAYARYYAGGANTATLQGYGRMLEALVRGQLLPPALTTGLMKDLKFDTYDAYRLEAGLPRSERFIHKTGTQWRRACHMGVVNPQDGGRNAIVVAACAEDLDEHADAGPAFEAVGRAITQTLLSPAPGR